MSLFIFFKIFQVVNNDNKTVAIQTNLKKTDDSDTAPLGLPAELLVIVVSFFCRDTRSVFRRALYYMDQGGEVPLSLAQRPHLSL